MFNTKNPVAIMYHYIRDKTCAYPLHFFDSEYFEWTIKKLRQSVDFISATEFIDGHKGIHLTFDDGYSEHFNVVFPILNDYNISGSFFPCSQSAIQQSILDVNRIQFLVNYFHSCDKLFDIYEAYQNKFLCETSGDVNPNNQWDIPLVNQIKADLQYRLPVNLRESALAYFEENVDRDLYESYKRDLYINKDQIAEMKDAGHFFGSHGHSHINYGQSKLEDALNDYLLSKEIFNDLVDSNIFCPPYGGINSNVIEQLKLLGVKYFWLAPNKTSSDYNSNEFLHRIDCNNISWLLDDN